jgi:hypothetical protein
MHDGPHLLDPIIPQLRIRDSGPQSDAARSVSSAHRSIRRINGPSDPQLALPAKDRLQGRIQDVAKQLGRSICVRCQRTGQVGILGDGDEGRGRGRRIVRGRKEGGARLGRGTDCDGWSESGDQPSMPDIASREISELTATDRSIPTLIASTRPCSHVAQSASRLADRRRPRARIQQVPPTLRLQAIGRIQEPCWTDACIRRGRGRGPVV